MTSRPVALGVKFRLRGNKNFNLSGNAHIGVTLTDWFVTGSETNPNNPQHIVERNNLITTSMASVQQGYITYGVTFQLDPLTIAQYNSLNLHPKLAFIIWHEAQVIDPTTGMLITKYSLVDMELSVVEVEYILIENIDTCTQFAFPISDTPALTDGVWVDNAGDQFANKWATVDEGVATFNDNNHVTFPTQIGQTAFPKIGFGVEQITLDPTSMKLNFRGGGIEPSGSVAHTMTFAALYDTNGITVATNGSTPIASLSGDLRSYTVNMKLAVANRNLWDLSRPQLEMKFFVSDDNPLERDLRFSAVEIETCGTCPPRDTGNITLVLENLDDCEPENIMRPNVDIDVLPSGEWTLCGEVVDTCLKVDAFAGDGSQKCPGVDPLFNPPELSTEELQWVNPGNIIGAEGDVAVTGRDYVVQQGSISVNEVITSCTLVGTSFGFADLLPGNVDEITGLKVVMKRRGRIQEPLISTTGIANMSIVENHVYLLEG